MEKTDRYPEQIKNTVREYGLMASDQPVSFPYDASPRMRFNDLITSIDCDDDIAFVESETKRLLRVVEQQEIDDSRLSPHIPKLSPGACKIQVINTDALQQKRKISVEGKFGMHCKCTWLTLQS